MHSYYSVDYTPGKSPARRSQPTSSSYDLLDTFGCIVSIRHLAYASYSYILVYGSFIFFETGTH